MCQWCEDWYQASMNSDELRKRYPAFNGDGGGNKYRVMRGASWYNHDPDGLLSSLRDAYEPGFRCAGYGFRVVVVVPIAATAIPRPVFPSPTASSMTSASISPVSAPTSVVHPTDLQDMKIPPGQ